MGECRISCSGLLGAFRRFNLPLHKRTNAGCLGSRQFNLPYRDSWLALPYQSLCDPSCECAYLRAGRPDRRNVWATTASRQDYASHLFSQDRYKLKAREHQAHAPSIKDELKVYPRNFLRTIAAIPSIPLPNITRLLGSGEGSAIDVPPTVKAVSPCGLTDWNRFVLSCCPQPGSPLPAAPHERIQQSAYYLKNCFGTLEPISKISPHENEDTSKL